MLNKKISASKVLSIIAVVLIIAAFILSYKDFQSRQSELTSELSIDSFSIPIYKDKPYIIINNNEPFFTAEQKTFKKSFESYSKLDNLGRCGVAFACIGMDLMPQEERGSISSIKPSGWQTTQYDIISGKYLYNRCHLIGFQLTGENANKYNLVTGTRYLNIDGMVSFENMTAEYIKSTNNHVLYRVTPIFEGENLICSGLLMEAYSIEDQGELSFCVFCYNVQPGIIINYLDGTSKLK